ncbi:MAG: hypothetical protein P4M04_15860 [Acidobacteriota bacterium]|nr:hypothetical protein [Acidobacteriota bacterium]
MKIGTENRVKTGTAAALGLLAIVLVVRAFRGGDENPPVPAQTAAVTTSAPATSPAQPRTPGTQAKSKTTNPVLAKSLDPTLRFELLKSSEEVTYKGAGRDIFRSLAEVKIPTPLPPDKQPNYVPPPPPPPPINLKFYGFAGPRNGSKRIFLLKGEDIFVAKEGDIVDRRYRIVRIGPNSVEVEDVLTNNRQTLPLSMG